MASPIHSARMIHFDSDDVDPTRVSHASHRRGRVPLAGFLAEHDIIVNCVLQDTDAPLMFLTEDDLTTLTSRHDRHRRLLRRGHGVLAGRGRRRSPSRRSTSARRHLLRRRPQPAPPVATPRPGRTARHCCRFIRTVLGGTRAWDADPTIRRADRDPRGRHPEPRHPQVPGPRAGSSAPARLRLSLSAEKASPAVPSGGPRRRGSRAVGFYADMGGTTNVVRRGSRILSSVPLACADRQCRCDGTDPPSSSVDFRQPNLGHPLALGRGHPFRGESGRWSRGRDPVAFPRRASVVHSGSMSSYLLVPGAGGAAWYWHRLVPELERRGHDVVSVDLPAADDGAGLEEYAQAVVHAAGPRQDVVVVAQSMGGLTAPMVCGRLPVSRLVLVNAMVPAPGETGGEWWANTGQDQARREHDLREGRSPDAPFDPLVYFFHDVPKPVTKVAMAAEPPSQGRRSSSPGPWTAGRTYPPWCSAVARTDSSPSSSRRGWPRSGSESRRRPCPVVTSWRSADQQNWPRPWNGDVRAPTVTRT